MGGVAKRGVVSEFCAARLRARSLCNPLARFQDPPLVCDDSSRQYLWDLVGGGRGCKPKQTYPTVVIGFPAFAAGPMQEVVIALTTVSNPAPMSIRSSYMTLGVALAHPSYIMTMIHVFFLLVGNTDGLIIACTWMMYSYGIHTCDLEPPPPFQFRRSSEVVPVLKLKGHSQFPVNSFQFHPQTGPHPSLLIWSIDHTHYLRRLYNLWPQSCDPVCQECFYPAAAFIKFSCLQVFKQSQEMILKWIVLNCGGVLGYCGDSCMSIVSSGVVVKLLQKSWSMHVCSSPATFHI